MGCQVAELRVDVADERQDRRRNRARIAFACTGRADIEHDRELTAVEHRFELVRLDARQAKLFHEVDALSPLHNDHERQQRHHDDDGPSAKVLERGEHAIDGVVKRAAGGDGAAGPYQRTDAVVDDERERASSGRPARGGATVENPGMNLAMRSDLRPHRSNRASVSRTQESGESEIRQSVLSIR